MASASLDQTIRVWDISGERKTLTVYESACMHVSNMYTCKLDQRKRDLADMNAHGKITSPRAHYSPGDN